MNDLSRQGYRFVAVAHWSGDTPGMVVVMEYVSGGLAGSVEAEALQRGFPSQGPTVEQQWLEPTPGMGQV